MMPQLMLTKNLKFFMMSDLRVSVDMHRKQKSAMKHCYSKSSHGYP